MIYHFTVSTDFKSPDELRFLESRKHIAHQTVFIPIIFDVYPGNVERFNYLPTEVKADDWVLFTDTTDVIFQKELPDLNAVHCDMYVGNERAIHLGSYWDVVVQSNKLYRNLIDQPIYNGGMFIMRGSVYLEYLIYFGYASKMVENTFYDQLIFNQFIYHEKPKINDDITVLCPLYNNMDIGLCKRMNGIWKSDLDETISCIHANGSYKKYLV